jgi:hypothetical protein
VNTISPSELAVGDIIVDGKRSTKVFELAHCPSHTRGVGRTHVNKTLCYDNVVALQVRQKNLLAAVGQWAVRHN